MAVKQMKTLGISKQEFKRIRKQAKKRARKCPYGKSETTEGSEDTEEDTTTTEGSDDGAEKDCTTLLKENQCNNKWGGICSWNGVSCGSSSGGSGISVVGFGSVLDSVSESSGQGQGKGNGNGGGKLKPNKPFKPDKQGGSVNISGGSVSGGGQGGGKWGGNKPNKLDKPWGGNKPQGSGSAGKVKPNQGNQGGGSSSGESEDSGDTVTTEETEDSEETEESEDTSEDDGDEVDCYSAPKEMPCSKKGGGVCAWINGSCQPKRRHHYLRR